MIEEITSSTVSFPDLPIYSILIILQKMIEMLGKMRNTGHFDLRRSQTIGHFERYFQYIDFIEFILLTKNKVYQFSFRYLDFTTPYKGGHVGHVWKVI